MMSTRSIITILIFSFVSVSVQAQSFFSKGNWAKVGVKEQGVYQLDKNYLESIGVDVSEPELITVFGGDGDVLPQLNSETKKVEPLEVPTLLLDTGVYQNNFSIFFYNEGAKKITLDENGLLDTRLNIYTDTVFYYIGLSENQSLRIEEQNNLLNDSEGTITVYNHRENDEVNLFTSGRVWLSDRMDSKTPSSLIESPIYNLKSDVSIKYDFIGSSSVNSIYYNFFVEDSLLFSNKVLRSNSGYGVKVRSTSGEELIPRELFSENKASFTVALDNVGDVNTYGYINFLSWQYETEASELNVNVPFYNLGKSKKITFEKNNDSQILWSFNINNRNQKLIKGLADEDSVAYMLSSDTVELILVDLSEVQVPDYKMNVVSEDLFEFKSDVELLIVYHESLKSEVLRFQEHKEGLGIKTEIAEVGDVFEQYSNGKKDISAIRNYVKHIYDNTTDFKYLLLFGDCSYDYKDHFNGNTNMIPVYESLESYHDVQTFSSDDYYGFLGDNEGVWTESSTGNHTLEIAVGRFPTRDIEEAKIVVDKVIHYETANELGNWKNNIVFVADDGDGALHVDQANQLVEIVEGSAPFMEINKEYLDSYERSGNNVSLAREQLIKSIEDGAMFVNYTGHGSEYIWMGEELLTIQDINNLNNKDNLSVFITATCEFGRYDDPKILSGAEALLINEAGAISLVTTTRPVYSSSNFAINTSFYKEVFSKKTEGKFRTIGEIFRETKNNSLNGVFNRNFSLLGDPSINLKLPNSRVLLETIDGVGASSYIDTIIPGQTIELEGMIVDEFGVFDPDFNGIVEVSVLEASEIKSTLGYGNQEKATFSGDASIIYSAIADVQNGKYRIEVALPIEIASSFGFSDILFYAYSNGNEAYGVEEDVIIGGNPKNLINELPQIEVVIINEDSILENGFVEIGFNLSDDYGILMSDEIIGKETILIKNGDKRNPIFLNDMLELVDGSAKNINAVIRIDIFSAEEIVFEIQTWDIHGQSAAKEFSLNLESTNRINVFPNPVSEELYIVSEKMVLGQDSNLEMKVYNSTGEIVYEGNLASDKTNYVNELKIKIEDLGIIEEGIYYYDINVRYVSTDSVFNKKGKLIKL